MRGTKGRTPEARAAHEPELPGRIIEPQPERDEMLESVIGDLKERIDGNVILGKPEFPSIEQRAEPGGCAVCDDPILKAGRKLEKEIERLLRGRRG